MVKPRYDTERIHATTPRGNDISEYNPL
ncbi:MAG: hypothetical protein ACIPMY_07135 [Rickettsia endosymbiont of Pentastiridius leporinus]